MVRTRVKICGITSLEDALAAIDAGADALGFVFYPPSPRAVTVQQAAEIIRRLPPFITTVGLFVNETTDAVAAAAEQAQLDVLQFHGDESARFCAQTSAVAGGRPWFRALRMKPGLDIKAQADDFLSAGARAVLLDAYRPGVPGGTGETFNWAQIPEAFPGSLILAGGLTPDNIRNAISCVKPYAVDVSGGVEAAKGIKDSQKIDLFIKEVARANQ
ncbi:MAG: phosphoribosylanthranilate isomerase [Marinobacterium sp.]|nr:phosphoribosylanthranilate isomerase [Marinobacterium sp.]